MDRAFHLLSHFICKISLVTLLYAWSTEIYQMLCIARKGGAVRAVQGNALNSPWRGTRNLLHDTSEKCSQNPGTATAIVNYQFGLLFFFSWMQHLYSYNIFL